MLITSRDLVNSCYVFRVKYQLVVINIDNQQRALIETHITSYVVGCRCSIKLKCKAWCLCKGKRASQHYTITFLSLLNYKVECLTWIFVSMVLETGFKLFQISLFMYCQCQCNCFQIEHEVFVIHINSFVLWTSYIRFKIDHSYTNITTFYQTTSPVQSAASNGNYR